ncbi:MAG TPA: hypothetical protein VHD85_05065 [Terracidiphilus sp.]|nr:hypothetical protein [Terracidiphilus sp.]
MGLKWKQAALTAIVIAALSGVASHAQSGADSQAQANSARRAPATESEPQFDIGASFYEALNNSSSGNGTQQTTTNAQGGMVEARYIQSSLIGFELTFGFNPADQTFSPKTGACGFACANAVTPLSAKASEVALDWVFSKKYGNFRPFAVAGMGFFITSPSNSKYEVNTVVRGTFIGGGGVDVGLSRRFGIRAQFRDNVYKAPNLSAFYPATGVYTQTLEPMVGFYFRP